MIEYIVIALLLLAAELAYLRLRINVISLISLMSVPHTKQSFCVVVVLSSPLGFGYGALYLVSNIRGYWLV